jgi:hypothetical protein
MRHGAAINRSADMRKWITVTETFCQGMIPLCSITNKDGESVPCLFKTRELAEAEIADNLIAQLQEVKNGCRTLDECDLSGEFACAVEVDEGNRFKYAGRSYVGFDDVTSGED